MTQRRPTLTRVVRLVPLAALTLLASACLHDLFRSNIPLTEEEVLNVFEMVLSVVLGEAEGRPVQALGTVTAPCWDGKMTVDYTDVVTKHTSEGPKLAFSYRANPEGCSTYSWGSPAIVFDGDPTVDGAVTMTVERTSTYPSFTHMTSSGGFRYRTADGRTGTCEMDLTFTDNRPTPQSSTASWKGTACGLQIDESW